MNGNCKKESAIHRRESQYRATHNANGKDQRQGGHYEVSYALEVRQVTIQLHMALSNDQQLTCKTAYQCNKQFPQCYLEIVPHMH